MDSLILYLLKVSLCVATLYIAFYLFFSKDTFYIRNRILLIMGLILSFTIPVVSVYKPGNNMLVLKQSGIVNNLISTGSGFDNAISQEISKFNFVSIISIVYFSVAFFLLIRMLRGIFVIINILRKGQTDNTKYPDLIISGIADSPFSFYKYVVIPRKIFDAGDFNEILEHEKIHVSQHHTIDLIFCEILTAVLWFNPFIWMTKRAIVLNHEFLADRNVVSTTSNIKEYQYRLLNIKKSSLINIASHNFSSLIKNRLVMINKKQSTGLASFKILLLVPIAFILFTTLSFRTEKGQQSDSEQKQLFSNSSKNELLKFIAMNTGYPQESKNSSDTGSIFVTVKIDKGGIVKTCSASTDIKSIKVPLMDQVVIVGYKSGTTSMHINDDHALLKAECIRIAKKIGEVSIPEWKEKDHEFALSFKFVLK